MSPLRARASARQTVQEGLAVNEPETGAAPTQDASQEPGRPTGLRRAKKSPLEAPDCRSPLGLLTGALRDERLQGDPLQGRIREALEAVRTDHLFYPFPEADQSYLPLLADLAAHPSTEFSLREEIQASTDAFRLVNPFVQKRITFPYATKLAEVFQSIEPYRAEKKSSHPRFSTYLTASLRGGERASASVDLHAEAAEALNASLLAIEHDKAFFEAIEHKDGDSLYAKYNLISGSRLVAVFEPGTIRAALVEAGATAQGGEGLETTQERPSAAPRTAKVGATLRIGAEALEILERSTIGGNTLKLPAQLERKLYLEVAKVLETLGGKWDRSAGGHVFKDDPGTLIQAALESGQALDEKTHFQFFQTPRALATRMIDLAGIQPGQKILEPSAGEGGILEPLLERLPRAERRAEKLADGTEVHACELNPEMWARLEGLPIHLAAVDFLSFNPGPTFDRIVANPPFTRGQDVAHANHMLDCLKPGGRLVTVLSAGVQYRSDKATAAFKARLEQECPGFEMIEIGHGAFKDSGTMVNSLLLVATKQS